MTHGFLCDVVIRRQGPERVQQLGGEGGLHPTQVRAQDLLFEEHQLHGQRLDRYASPGKTNNTTAIRPAISKASSREAGEQLLQPPVYNNYHKPTTTGITIGRDASMTQPIDYQSGRYCPPLSMQVLCVSRI